MTPKLFYFPLCFFENREVRLHGKKSYVLNQVLNHLSIYFLKNGGKENILHSYLIEGDKNFDRQWAAEFQGI